MPKKKSTKKSKSKSNNLGLYANLVHRRKTKRDAAARAKAEYLATLPKNPVKRFFYRLHPKRVLKYWFSKRGLKMALKIIAVFILLVAIGIGGLFMYFRKDLDAIRPGELAKRVQSTVNTYTDRNGVVLWEDKGSGNYKLVVDGDKISKYMRQATVAIEDKEFYKHHGISITGIARALLNNLGGGSTQGGSTLTQQLIKQVYFSDEASIRDAAGIPRKIKEMILAIEVERMYDKEQIITLYLNESPYGGRRNGVESGAQTYFGKTAKDLDLAESALLASIPNNPAVLDPYNVEGNELLISRQHKTLDAMVDMGYITKQQAKEAKEIPILDRIKPTTDQYDNIKAPHFVLEVKKQLEAELGVKTVRSGGLTIKTTLDYEAQKIAEESVQNGRQYLYLSRSDNIALSSVDVQTGQVIAMVGSIDWNQPGYGQNNAATSPLEPGSSIKPVADYAPLFKQRTGLNFGPGSVLKDENIDNIYCNGAARGCHVQNFTGKFYGNITIRQALANSLNIPAIKAMYINGVEDSLKTARDLGDLHYCTDNNNAGLSAAIGGGCTVLPVEHTNAYATFARGGTYKPLSYVIEVKNSSKNVIKKWEDTEGKQAVDPQVAYMISDTLADPKARASLVWGSSAYGYGFVIPGVWSAVKTGTTDNGSGKSKDLWVASYSSAISTTVWNGNHDGSAMQGNDSMHVLGRHVVNDYMERVHKEVYAKQGKWKTGDQPAKPAGIKTATVNGRSDIWPSWFDVKNSGVKKQTMTFDSISLKKATNCTPDSTRVAIEVTIISDPVTKKDVFTADGYDPDHDDDIHQCTDQKPNATISGASPNVSITFTTGTFQLKSYVLYINGAQVSSGAVTGSSISITHDPSYIGKPISIRVIDEGGYDVTVNGTYT
ncbi:MAG: penicillin-binding protein [Candidatus Nomurabacteria bacterium]|nr:penicillin-binding protein [Candidatus Nomurabacteria bacterium]